MSNTEYKKVIFELLSGAKFIAKQKVFYDEIGNEIISSEPNTFYDIAQYQMVMTAQGPQLVVQLLAEQLGVEKITYNSNAISYVLEFNENTDFNVRLKNMYGDKLRIAQDKNIPVASADVIQVAQNIITKPHVNSPILQMKR